MIVWSGLSGLVCRRNWSITVMASYTDTHTHTHAHAHPPTHAHKHTCKHTYAHTCTRTHIRTRTESRTRTQSLAWSVNDFIFFLTSGYEGGLLRSFPHHLVLSLTVYPL